MAAQLGLLKGNPFPVQQWELDAIDGLSGALSISQLRFTVSFLVSVLAGVGFKYVPTTKGRHLYALITGFLLIYYPFGHGCFHAFLPTALTYFAMVQFGQHAGTLSWLVTFSYLLYCHISSASGQAWKEGRMDFTGAMMVLTLKVISVAMCYQDGQKPDNEMKTAYQASHKLTKLPSLLEYLSYVFSFGNLLAGPFFEIHDYLECAERTGVWDPKAKRPMPSPLVPGIMRLVKGLACAAAHIWLSGIFPVAALEGKQYQTFNMFHKIGIIWITAFAYRLRYYFAWAVSESSLIFAGLCWAGYEEGPRGRARWDRCVNTRIRRVEFGNSAAELPQHWNVATGLFLRRYVYDRLTPKGKKASLLTMVITQTVSGLWHGVFPGYGLFFVSSAFFFESSKAIYRYERNWSPYWRKFPPWAILKYFYTQATLQYLGSAFMILSLWESIAVYQSVHFFGHMLILCIFLVSLVFPPKTPRKAKSNGVKSGVAFDKPEPTAVGVTDSHQGSDKKVE